MRDYFEELKGNYVNDYLTKQPKKAEAIANAKRDGVAVILPNSNNRALIIADDSAVYLQSYDTMILKATETAEGVLICKMWNGYSKTTLKHVNEFMTKYTGAVNTFNKKEWEQFEEAIF